MRRWLPTIVAALLLTAGALAQIGGGGIVGGGGGGFTEVPFTLSWDPSCSANFNQNYTYELSGKVVVLQATQAILCTSDTTDMTTLSGALPAAIRPAHALTLPILRVQDNGAGVAGMGCLNLATDGTVTITYSLGGAVNCQTATFTAASTKGFALAYGQWVYTLN